MAGIYVKLRVDKRSARSFAEMRRVSGIHAPQVAAAATPSAPDAEPTNRAERRKAARSKGKR